MHIAIITAGGAGMFCGACMHDNTWAKALRKAGAEVTLIPTYTPIRVDEEDMSVERVFLGGINVYLDQQSKLWRKLPRWMTTWLDHPAVIKLATSFGVTNDARKLGELTLAMLDGELGPARRQIEELAEFIGRDLKPDVVCFSNALLSGTVRLIRSHFSGPIYCTLQGDDVFIDSLPDPYRQACIRSMSERVREFDGIVVHSEFYRDHMSQMLSVPPELFEILPLGIDLTGHDGLVDKPESDSLTVGYFGRICPEKGLHQLIEAVLKLPCHGPRVRLVAGGYLGTRDARYFDEVSRAGKALGDRFTYAGSPPDRESKVELLKSFDIFSMPTTYREPKGISVLEALANGVPVVQPAHGAFVEMLSATEGGLLFEPGDPIDLATRIDELAHDRERRIELARKGQMAVRTRFSSEVMAATTLAIFANEPPNRRLSRVTDPVGVETS